VLGEELQTRRGCLIKEEYFDNFYKDNCGIKILHGVLEESMGVEEELLLWESQGGIGSSIQWPKKKSKKINNK